MPQSTPPCARTCPSTRWTRAAGGDASRRDRDLGELARSSSYSGAAVQNDLDSNFASQETLVTISNDTGGKAFLDTNDFSKAYAKVQADSETYYVLGYRSSNRESGWTLPPHSGEAEPRASSWNIAWDTTAQGLPALHQGRSRRAVAAKSRVRSAEDRSPSYLATGYFRTPESKYYVPVSIVVPASALAMQRDKDKASLDVMGVVRDKKTKFPVGNVRDNIKLTQEQTESVDRSRRPMPRSRSPAPKAQQRAVQHGVPVAAGQLSPEVRGERKPERTVGTFESERQFPTCARKSSRLARSSCPAREFRGKNSPSNR